jgi:hypothetical protein
MFIALMKVWKPYPNLCKHRFCLDHPSLNHQ